MGQGNDFPVC